MRRRGRSGPGRCAIQASRRAWRPSSAQHVAQRDVAPGRVDASRTGPRGGVLAAGDRHLQRGHAVHAAMKRSMAGTASLGGQSCSTQQPRARHSQLRQRAEVRGCGSGRSSRASRRHHEKPLRVQAVDVQHRGRRPRAAAPFASSQSNATCTPEPQWPRRRDRLLTMSSRSASAKPASATRPSPVCSPSRPSSGWTYSTTVK